tara:strand:+ start:1214 stop:1714 length:501 start_codon:yes stop_codon:yes gene_type:complete
MANTSKIHTNDLYSTLLNLSRNIFFYKKIGLPDTFETRIYLMFIHFSVMMIVFKNKGKKFNQKSYDSLFHNIEYNLREMGFGDVSVNKKMKDFNKLLYDILLKLNKKNDVNEFKINEKLIIDYFKDLKDTKNTKYIDFERYFSNFYNFCFEIPLDNMIRDLLNFKG